MVTFISFLLIGLSLVEVARSSCFCNGLCSNLKPGCRYGEEVSVFADLMDTLWMVFCGWLWLPLFSQSSVSWHKYFQIRRIVKEDEVCYSHCEDTFSLAVQQAACFKGCLSEGCSASTLQVSIIFQLIRYPEDIKFYNWRGKHGL